jgi:hypothetical protein
VRDDRIVVAFPRGGKREFEPRFVMRAASPVKPRPA